MPRAARTGSARAEPGSADAQLVSFVDLAPTILAMAGEPAPPPAAAMPPGDSDHPGEAMRLAVDRPLHDAARRGERGLVSLFLSKGANADLPAGPHGATALHYAAGAGEVLIIDLLLALPLGLVVGAIVAGALHGARRLRADRKIVV